MSGTSKSTMVALRLTVRNHPGVMSHICGLFARRAFNMEGIFVMPVDSTGTSRVWVLVADDERLEQAVRQTGKLHDVLDVSVRPDGVEAFSRFSTFMTVWEGMASGNVG